MVANQAFLIMIILLTACTTNKMQDYNQNNNSPQWNQQKKILQEIVRYQIRGSFVLIFNQKKIYARFSWKQSTQDRYRILLTNQIGNIELQLDVQDSVAKLIDSKGRHYISNDAEKMISQLTGVDIPLASMRQWILGLPNGATDFILNKNHQMQSARYKHNGKIWNVNIQKYNNMIKPALPIIIEITQDNKIIKIYIDIWTIQ